MGVDKSLVIVGGATLLDTAVSSLADAECDPVLVLHRRPETLQRFGFDVRLDVHGGEGPLDGLLSAFVHGERAIVVTRPVDLPNVDSRVIRRLVSALVTQPELDGVALSDGATRQHLCAAWRPERCRDVLARRFQAGERSAKRALDDVNLGWMIVSSDRLRNVNTVDDIDDRGTPGFDVDERPLA